MNHGPTLSIVIPTHKRAATLRQCLDHLAVQTIAGELEVIVVNDGGDEETREMMRATSGKRQAARYFEISKSQQGVARNRGVEKATAPITLFIGDDIFLAPDACEIHLRTHTGIRYSAFGIRKAVATLGFTTWDPSVGITPVMRWLDKTGW